MQINNFIIKSIIPHSAKLTAISSPIRSATLFRNSSTEVQKDHDRSNKFETVFSFPLARHIATLNRMKMYHIISTSLAIPGCALLETLNMLPQYSFLTAAYIGVTGGVLLSLGSLPFNNTIGFLYISEDDKLVKISSVDFWGRRKDKIVSTDDWIPLLDIKQRTMDAIYLTPQLTDGSKYKLFIKFGKILNSKKMGEVLE